MGDVALRAPGGQRLVYRSQADDSFARRVVWDGFRSWESSTVEYVAVVDAEALEPVQIVAGDCVLALAVRFGKTRLIDNTLLCVGDV
jgi:pantoate--beta-alanine ligase